jgi:DNA-binding CsgD family transcriptional regulator
MSLCLSSEDLEHLTEATRLLLSPLEFPTVDEWRSAVNRQLKTLLHADSAGFLLPMAEGIALYSDEHDPAALSRYPELTPPGLSDGTPIWARSIELGVTTLREGYGQDYESYLQTAYHNEFAAPNRAFDTLGAWCSLGGADASSAASLQLWHSHPTRQCFGAREVTLLRLLLPAFRAGVLAQLAWSSYSAQLLQTLDSLEQPALVGDISGRVVHQTPALRVALGADPEHDRLRAEMLDLLKDVGDLARTSAQLDYLPTVVRSVTTLTGRYRVRACLYGESKTGSCDFVIVALEFLGRCIVGCEDLRARYGLTPAEIRVALLLARGKSNIEIAQELFISPHTSKRHTEHVLHKLGARSRAEVGSKIIGTHA